MNALLELIKTDEQRLKILVELLWDNKMLFIIEDAIKNHMWHVADYDTDEQIQESYNILYRVLDSYKHPENYSDEAIVE